MLFGTLSERVRLCTAGRFCVRRGGSREWETGIPSWQLRHFARVFPFASYGIYSSPFLRVFPQSRHVIVCICFFLRFIFYKFFLAISGDSYAFFGVVSEVVAPSNRGEDDIAEFFLEFIFGMKILVFCRIAFPSAEIAEYFPHADNNLIES